MKRTEKIFYEIETDIDNDEGISLSYVKGEDTVDLELVEPDESDDGYFVTLTKEKAVELYKVLGAILDDMKS